MVQLILIFAILNVLLGYALAATLADPPLGGFAPWKHWRSWKEWKLWPLRLPRIKPAMAVTAAGDTEAIPPAGQPAPSIATTALADEPPLGELAEMPLDVAGVDELPSAWRDQLASEQLIPDSFAEGVAHSLRGQLAIYRQHALAAEGRARLVLAEENAAAVEQLVADFRFLHHEWLTQLLLGSELLHERRGRHGAIEQAACSLESLLYDHAARMEAIDRAISDINFKTDVVLGCRQLLEELMELSTAIHRLRDELTAALAAILQQQGTLAALPREQRLDPLTGRLNRLGLQAAFRAMEGPRQAVLIAWDEFHLVNERLGTRAGDRILRTLSQLVTELLAESHAAAEMARLTGTQLLLLFDGASRDQATSLAEQIRQSLEGVTVDCQGTALDVSARMGITSVTAADTLETLLERLERALDAAELAGRNRCALTEENESRIVAPHQVSVTARRVEVDHAGELVAQP